MRASPFVTSVISVSFLFAQGAATAAEPAAPAGAEPGPTSLDEPQPAPAAPVVPVLVPQIHEAVPPGFPLVRLRTDNYRARLQTIAPTGRWKDVCASPCRLHLDPAAAYRVGGGNVNNSSELRLPRDRNEVLLDVHAGSKTQFWVGTIMGLVGVGNVLGGFLYRSLGDDTGNGLTQQQRDTYKTLGSVEIGVGAALAVVGLIVAVTANTSVDVQ